MRLSLPLCAALTAAVLIPIGCSDGSAHAKDAAAVAQKAETAHPTQERLVARVSARWAHIVKEDWIQAYDFQTPQVKAAAALSQYLMNKSNHKYANPRVSEVLRCADGDAAVKVTALWTPQHPKLKHVELEPGQSLTQEIELIESWRWVEGEWGYVRAQRPEEFFRDHPEYLRAEPVEPVKTADTGNPAK